MTDAVLVLRKLSVLRDFVARSARRRPQTADALAADEDVQDALAFGFVVAVQEALDIAFHLAADEGWGVPATNREAFDMVARHGVITGDLAARLGAVVSVRNRVAHGYATVDLERFWLELPAGLSTLAEYADAVARFVVGSDA